MNKDLGELLKRNGIDTAYFEQLAYDMMIQSCFQMLCKLMKNDPEIRQSILDRFHHTNNNIWTTKMIVKQYIGCHLSDSEAETVFSYISAFFRKTGARAVISTAETEKLKRSQNYRCNICGRDLRSTKAELDHIVPWELVGDALDHNHQLICRSCNRRKSNRLDYALCKLLLKIDD